MDDIVAALEALESEGSFHAKQTLPASGLHIQVKGVGPLKFPLTPAGVKPLLAVAQPARFGWRDQTLLDKAVRNTWEIPAGQLRVGDAAWNKTLQAALDEIAIDLGVSIKGSKASALYAHLHNMLIYGPGQFFRPHQDSEKLPGMVATLIVVLPSPHEGGALLIEHQGRERRFQGAPAGRKLRLIAFYADCLHQLKPVRKGYRVVLTYNLVLGGTGGASGAGATFPAATLSAALCRYFETPQSVPSFGTSKAPARPKKWVYLLDHQYTQKGLSWKHLKNGDLLRAKVLAQVAQELNLDVFLALAEIQETWEAYSEDDDEYYGDARRRRWYWDDGDEDLGGEDTDEQMEEERTGPEGYVLQSLIDDSVELRHWVDVRGKAVRRPNELVSWDELCLTTATQEFDPFESEYEGNMGNYGNTLDRWYHRGAIVLVRRRTAAAPAAKSRPSRRTGPRKAAPARRRVSTRKR